MRDRHYLPAQEGIRNDFERAGVDIRAALGDQLAKVTVHRAVFRGECGYLAGRKACGRANAEERKHLSLWSHRNLVFGVPAIFIYLIAEIGVANLFINFVSQPDIGNMTHAEAANYLVLLWGGMMVGRFAGAFLMRSFAAESILAAYAGAALVVMIAAATINGQAAMWALILVGLCHSIMFPTIFALAIKGLGPLTEEGSGLLITAIAGGALVVVEGWLADMVGLQKSGSISRFVEQG